MEIYEQITSCRLGGGNDFVEVLDLGEHCLSGVFPKPGEDVPRAPLKLVYETGTGLLQLKHSVNPVLMYGDNYGYRSGLNFSMVKHLRDTVARLERICDLRHHDAVLDIGCNDGTLLKAYRENPTLRRIGFDPTAWKFRNHYPESADLHIHPTFFSSDEYLAKHPPARIVTSMAMLYDLEYPTSFAMRVNEVLAPDGIWHFEQSYMPAMIDNGSYDTICHEHLTYLTLRNVQTILEAAGMKIVDVRMNAVNGGSFAVTAAKLSNGHRRQTDAVEQTIEGEDMWMFHVEDRLKAFAKRARDHRIDLQQLLSELRTEGKTVFGYGASTKGNTLLQFCDIDSDLVHSIAEINQDKFGRLTPGTGIPIHSETEISKMDPKYFLVLPWHFRDGIIQRERVFLEHGGKLIFPLPRIDVVGG